MASNNYIDPKKMNLVNRRNWQMGAQRRETFEARLAADTVGESPVVKQLTALGMVTEAGEEAEVQQYVGPALDHVKSHADSIGQLRATLPILKQTLATISQDALISDKNRAHAQKRIQELIKIVEAQITLKNRLASTFRNVARAKPGAMTEGMQQSASPLVRMAGTLIAKRQAKQERATEQKRETLNVRAAALEQAQASRDLQDFAEKGHESGWQGADGMSPHRAGASPTRAAGTGKDTSGGVGGSPVVFKAMLDVGVKTYKEVESVKRVLLDQKELDAEQYELDDKARERGADNTKKDDFFAKLAGLFGMKSTTQPVPTGQTSGGMLDAVKVLLAKDALSALSSIIGPTFAAIKTAALATLGEIATLASAAFIPTVVLGAQAALANHLAGIFNDIMDEYPALKRGDKTAKDDVQAVADLPKNVEQVLKKGGKVLEPKGGFITEAELAESRRMGLNPGEYKKRQGTQYAKRKAAEAAKPVVAPPAPPPSVQPTPLSSRNIGANVGVLPSAQSDIDVTPALQTGPATPERVKTKPAGQLSMSDKGFKLLQQREGFPQDSKGNAVAYDDGGGVWTIGYGTTQIDGKPVTPGMKISRARAIEEFHKQVKTTYEPDVRDNLGDTNVTQDQFDSLVSLAYNHRASGRKAARKLAAGEELTPSDFTRTATVKGIPNAGLASRRLGEYNQFTGASFEPRSTAPVMASNAPTGSRSAAALAGATTAAGGGRVASAPIVVATNNIGGGGTVVVPGPPVLPIPIDPDNRGTVRGVTGYAGNPLA